MTRPEQTPDPDVTPGRPGQREHTEGAADVEPSTTAAADVEPSAPQDTDTERTGLEATDSSDSTEESRVEEQSAAAAYASAADGDPADHDAQHAHHAHHAEDHVGRWGRLGRLLDPRPTRAKLLVAGIALLFGFGFVTQVQQTRGGNLENLREDELVRVLDDVTQNGTRLASELRDLEQTRAALTAGAGASEQAQKAAQERLDTLGVLAGTVPVRGQGITVTIRDPGRALTAPVLLDALEELRDAGAEAIQIGPVRVVASTYFTDTDQGITVSGELLTPPYRIIAIGDAATMASAMDIPGGVTESVRRLGGTATVAQHKSVTIRALHALEQPRYAQPVPEASARPSN